MPGDEGLALALGRYLKVSVDELPACFMISKKIPARISGSLEKDWKEHERGIKEFRKLKSSLSGFSEFDDLPDAKPNLMDLKAAIADKLTEACVFCERRCRVNRKEGKLGWCRVGYVGRVASAFIHVGEEPELVPSGTIFFAGCNARCVFCQNWDISQYPRAGEEWTMEDFRAWVEPRRKAGRISNLNLVGGEPTPNLHTILKWLSSLETNIPVIWNSNMYLSEEAMALHEGAIDAYIDDFKWGSDGCAMRLSSMPNYWKTITRNNLLAKNFAELLVRHLVMPNHFECDTRPVFDWIKANLGEKARLNIMSQYRPDYKALEYPDISRRLHREEYEKAVDYARKIGLWNMETQPIF